MSIELSQRARYILAAVIAHYIVTAEPVGSRTIAKQSTLNVSPATIRNVMADLEDLGLLAQPHVSAGRVPTKQGLKFYVESILKVGEPDQQLKAQIRQAMEQEPVRDSNDILKAAGRALSLISRQVSVVAAPNPEHEIIKHLEFILLQPGLILVIFVLGQGGVQNRVIPAEPELSQDDLDKFTKYLNSLLVDLTLVEVKERVAREMAREKVRFDRVLGRALTLGKRALEAPVDGEVFIEGRTNLMDAPEFADVARLRQIFKAFEEKSTLLRLLEKAMLAQGVQIFIGAEDDEMGPLEGLTAVTASYGEDKGTRGALGVLGPTRMDYSRVIPVVDYTARLVSRFLDQKE